MVITKEEIVCNLLLKQISANKFMLSGTNIIWLQTPTSADISYYNSVISNYETLKTQYLADVQTAKDAEAAKQAAKVQDIVNNLPSWQSVSDAIDNVATLAAMKIIFKKVCRIVYWLAKNSQT